MTYEDKWLTRDKKIFRKNKAKEQNRLVFDEPRKKKKKKVRWRSKEEEQEQLDKFLGSNYDNRIA